MKSPIELLILQHPEEVHHIKNSARLLHLCVSNSEIMVGDSFDEVCLNQALNRNDYSPILLYPSIGDDSALESMTQQLISRSGRKLRLVVIDATWRKSRQMLARHNCLRSLPRFALRATPVSLYQIRKERSTDQLSTFEASCYGLMQLDQQNDYSYLLKAFKSFNQLQIEFGVNRLLRTK
jgi:DTW domain-containing protein YfiP